MMPLFAVLLVLAQSAQVATSAELGYRFPLPEGFVTFPAGAAQPDVVECWTENAPASASGALIMCVQRLRGTIGRELMRPQDMPPGSELVQYKWKGLDIQGMHTDTAESGTPVVILAAQVPLRPEAIQLIVTGPRDQTDRVATIMTATLASLEGETNWLTSEQRSGRLGNIVGLVLGIGVALLAVRWWRSRRTAAA